MVERKKEEIESVTCMFKFIDRAYSWALEGMKFVAMLDMDDCLNFDSCQLLIDKFDLYMKEHPAICDEDFDEILELARRYGNAKCMKQCEFARQKCAETVQLFNKRRDLIAKAKQQTKASSKKRMTSFRMKNRERLDKITSSKSPEPSFTSSVFDGSVTSSDGRSSVGDVSLISTDWSPMEDMSHQFVTSSSSNVTDHCDVSVNSAHNPKPARKLLKKSSSMPGHQMTCHMHSHAHSHSGVMIGSPMREDNVDSGKSKISLAIEELISTEKEYVRSLNYVIENYFPEMCRLDIPQALRCKRNVIFGNIEKIAQFHSAYFLRDLEKCDGNPAQVAKTFQMHKDSFGLYALYSKNKPLSDQLLNEHGNQFFKKKQLELGDKMDLASYLLKPVQRMAKYALLLHAMAKRSSGTEERSLKEAEELVKFQLRHGNDLLTMDSIRDCDVNLKEQGNLLRQEQFVIYSGRRKMIRRVFLFEDLILFSKPLKVNGAHDIYQYKCSYKTAEIGMTENIGEDGFKFEIWFRRRRSGTNQDRFVLQSSSRAVKRSWVEEIRGLLWKQALRNRDHRKLEMSSMGVGSKPHLDLAPSNKNRITDRSVTTPPLLLSDRLASSRTRASIAVCSFDHGALQSKRPHSTISTSSSTSSVGSGNNASIISSLTLASWPTKVDSRSFSGYSPPMAYCDFHAIEEDKDEGCEESTSQSSISTLLDDVVEVDEKPNSRQYVTTPNPHLLVK
ncbi:unnamed protein product [Clavelina lepadiformis]|uniref:Puratrophin-1 n=1 Tax=Clavelina lepadiformis TaxID=159417 RepID=A0ABP0FT25_CLALP